jgi:hypothetical protein
VLARIVGEGVARRGGSNLLFAKVIADAAIKVQ